MNDDEQAPISEMKESELHYSEMHYIVKLRCDVMAAAGTVPEPMSWVQGLQNRRDECVI